MHLYCKKTTLVARNWDLGGLIDNRPLGAEDVQCTGVENLAGDSTPRQLAPWLVLWRYLGGNFTNV